MIIKHKYMQSVLKHLKYSTIVYSFQETEERSASQTGECVYLGLPLGHLVNQKVMYKSIKVKKTMLWKLREHWSRGLQPC